jgi:hypothetical protein
LMLTSEGEVYFARADEGSAGVLAQKPQYFTAFFTVSADRCHWCPRHVRKIDRRRVWDAVRGPQINAWATGCGAGRPAPSDVTILTDATSCRYPEPPETRLCPTSP